MDQPLEMNMHKIFDGTQLVLFCFSILKLKHVQNLVAISSKLTMIIFTTVKVNCNKTSIDVLVKYDNRQLYQYSYQYSYQYIASYYKINNDVKNRRIF